jgi:hypothetical protein
LPTDPAILIVLNFSIIKLIGILGESGIISDSSDGQTEWTVTHEDMKFLWNRNISGYACWSYASQGQDGRINAQKLRKKS